MAELLYNVGGLTFKTDEGLIDYMLGANDIIQWKVKKISESYVVEKSIYRVEQGEQPGHHLIKL